MRYYRIFGVILCAATFITHAEAAPYTSHSLFIPETTPHQHIHQNWSMGCSLFPRVTSTVIDGNHWGFPYCNGQAPDEAGIYQFGVDFIATSWSHFNGSSATSGYKNNSDAWLYTGEEIRGTGATVMHYHSASGRRLWDSLTISYDFWYRETSAGPRISVFGNSPSQFNKWGLPE